MKYLLKKGRLVGLLLCLLPLSGCLDIAQELWVYENGHGRMKTEIGLHEQLMLLQGDKPDESVCDSLFVDRSSIEQREGVESVKYRSYKEGGVLFCVADVSVTDFTQLAQIQTEALKKNNVEGYLHGFQTEFSLKKLADDGGYFRQHIRNRVGDEDKSKLEAGAEQFTNSIMGRMMTGRYWTVVLHTPGLQETNGKADEDNKTVSWRVPLYDLLLDENYAYDMQASFKVKLPWYKKIWNWMN